MNGRYYLSLLEIQHFNGVIKIQIQMESPDKEGLIQIPKPDDLSVRRQQLSEILRERQEDSSFQTGPNTHYFQSSFDKDSGGFQQSQSYERLQVQNEDLSRQLQEYQAYF
jgi:hypothetical protein